LNLIPAISARELSFSYANRESQDQRRRAVLRSLSLTVAPGEVVIVTGASGAGKTTLLTLCGALRSVQDGDLRVLGKEMKGLDQAQQRELRSSIGFIFQSHNLIEALSAGQNVVMSLLSRLPIDEASARAESALASLGLGSRVDALPEELSGGEKQRVAVARALVRKPELILADEPTASLDDASAAVVKEAISDAARLSACAVLLVTHDARIFEIADRVLRLVDGDLEEMHLWSGMPDHSNEYVELRRGLTACCR
jgi:putative ABC transport system ATP-binding protein